MEIPYEIKNILLNTYTDNIIPSKKNYSEYIILEPSLYHYFTQNEKFVLMRLINELGHDNTATDDPYKYHKTSNWERILDFRGYNYIDQKSKDDILFKMKEELLHWLYI